MKNPLDKEAGIIKELNRLEDSLLSYSVADLKMPERDKVKKHLMSMIEEGSVKERQSYSLEKLAGAVRNAARTVFVPDWARVMMKERVLQYAESRATWSEEGIFAGFGVWYKRASALVVLTVFALTIVVVTPEKHAVVYAKPTFLENLTGEVFVKRQLKMVKAYPNMMLLEGDIVVSEGGSSATIRFFDDSVGRINEYTRLKISKLSYDSTRPVFSQVGVFLEDGRLWAKVMRLADDSSFEVSTRNLSAEVDSKAAFDVSVDAESTKVAVFENVVKVSPGNESSGPCKTVIAGYRAEVAGSGVTVSDVREANVTIEKMPRNEVFKTNNEWVAANLNNDREYTRELIADRENVIETGRVIEGAEVKSMLLPGTEGPEGKFEEAYGLLMTAESQLVRGEKEAAAAGLERFSAMMKELVAELPDLAVEDAAAAASLRTLMQERIALQLKELSSFLPDNNLYKAKETLQEMELLLAETEVKRAEIRLRQAGDILLEIETLIASDQAHLASTLLKKYQNKTNNITLKLTVENVREVKERFVPLIEGQAGHMKTLMAIENSIIYLNQNDLKEKVKDVREDTLRKFVTALEQMPEMVPADVLYDVNDLYATYVTDKQSETDIIEPAFAKLSDEKPNGVKFISPNQPEVPSQMGIFIMIPMEGTADVQSRVEMWSLNAAKGEQSKN